MTRTLLTAGKVGDIAHYVLDGEYVHSDKCLDVLLDEQISYDPDINDREGMWDTLVELGAWTVEATYEVDPEYDSPIDKCAVCGFGIVLAPVRVT